MPTGKTTRTPETRNPDRDIVKMLANQRKRVRGELDRSMKPEVQVARSTGMDQAFMADRARKVDSGIIKAEAAFQSHKANALRLLTAEVERGGIDEARAEKAFRQINGMSLGYGVPAGRAETYAKEHKAAEGQEIVKNGFNAMMAGGKK
jgi:hypothetical protein